MHVNKCKVVVFWFSAGKNSVNLTKNYYKVLDIELGCDQKVIKKSYLKLVKMHHPDVNPNGKQKFTQVQEAYQVLSDKQLKSYYDQNNYCKSGGQTSQNKQSTASSSSGSTHQYHTNGGHSYYTHRTYTSQNPSDYFSGGYKKPQDERKSKRNSQQKNKQQDDQEDQQDQQKQKKFDRNNFNKQQKFARSQASYQEYLRQQKIREQQMYKRQTLQEKKMRQKLKQMRGFTSNYNFLWATHHQRYTDVMPNYQNQKRKQEQFRKLMPQKVRMFYQKIINQLQKLATK